MKSIIVSFFTGGVFALGLGISGITNPNKVLNFLDVFGQWDPSLALVMAGAVGINLVLFPFILRRAHPVLSEKWNMPESAAVDRRLVLGAIFFGIGWGLAGFCPGPAFVTLSFGKSKVLVFVLSMIAGGLVFHFWNRVVKLDRL